MPQLLNLRTNIFRPQTSIKKSERKFPDHLETNFDTIEAAGKENRYRTRNAWKCLEQSRNTRRYIDKHHFQYAPAWHFKGAIETLPATSRPRLEISSPSRKKFPAHFQPFRSAWKRPQKRRPGYADGLEIYSIPYRNGLETALSNWQKKFLAARNRFLVRFQSPRPFPGGG
jgi:hypothetical protein